jgi:uncharacterized Fe-S cluster-containing radical SAM superfamily protein
MQFLKARVNPFERGIELRNTLAKEGKVLCVNFENTVQKQDLTKGHFRDEATGTYPYRSKVNIKDFDPELRAKQNLPPFDFTNHAAIYEAMKKEFDIPDWFRAKAGDSLENILPYDMPWIYQIKGCNFHDGSGIGGCVYCFVDNCSNSGKPDKGVYLSVENVLDSFQKVQKEKGTKVIRTSGGEPTLVLDHVLALYREMENRGIKPILVQFDTNLSTGKLIEHFENTGVYEKNTLEKIAEFDPKVLVAFKGTCNSCIKQNVQARCTVYDQIFTLKKLVAAGIDVYPYLYNPDPGTLERFVNKLEEHFENIVPRIHVGLLKTYTPTRQRIALLAQEQGVPADQLLASYEAEWAFNYAKSCEIMETLCLNKTEHHYKEIPRVDTERVKIRKAA